VKARKQSLAAGRRLQQRHPGRAGTPDRSKTSGVERRLPLDGGMRAMAPYEGILRSLCMNNDQRNPFKGIIRCTGHFEVSWCHCCCWEE